MKSNHNAFPQFVRSLLRKTSNITPTAIHIQRNRNAASKIIMRLSPNVSVASGIVISSRYGSGSAFLVFYCPYPRASRSTPR